MSTILLITDDVSLAEILSTESHSVVTVTSPERALLTTPRKKSFSHYDAALLDLDFPDWKDVLTNLRHHFPVICLCSGIMHRAVEAMKYGAVYVIEKPFDPGDIWEAVELYCDKNASSENGLDDMVGRSEPMLEVFALIRRAAMSDSNVLITGESGTGKEPVARAIHRYSPRKDKAFMTINCSAIPDTLFESELFGFEKGSFTGANYTKKGILELADGGTVFYDEIGDVSPLFQTKILRVLQEGEMMRIGGMRNIKVDARCIAATNKDLKAACRKGTFREDLFYRLNVINIHLPPLRERMEDVPLLVEYFVKRHAPKRKDLLIHSVSPASMELLMNYSYPGNVRELENMIERAISFANCPEIQPEDLPAFLQGNPLRKRAPVTRLKESVAAYERELIWSALQDSMGNISKAAEALGIYRQELQRKIKRLKIAT